MKDNIQYQEVRTKLKFARFYTGPFRGSVKHMSSSDRVVYFSLREEFGLELESAIDHFNLEQPTPNYDFILERLNNSRKHLNYLKSIAYPKIDTVQKDIKNWFFLPHPKMKSAINLLDCLVFRKKEAEKTLQFFLERYGKVGANMVRLWLAEKFLDKGEELVEMLMENKLKENKKSEYDIFISYSSEDRQEIARPLAIALQLEGLNVWFDEFELKLGDSLREKIDKGLSKSKYGLVILSSSFFNRKWTDYELSGFVAREMNDSKVILPIWHKVSKDEILRFSASLADKVALKSSDHSVKELAKKIGALFNKT